MPESLRTYLDFALDTAWQAGQLTLGHFQTDIRPDFKEDESPVTVADRAAEKLIRGQIERRFPGRTCSGSSARCRSCQVRRFGAVSPESGPGFQEDRIEAISLQRRSRCNRCS